MVAIKDFEMPESCAYCDLNYCKGWNDYFCDVMQEAVDVHSDKRHKDCPLVEVEDATN